MIASVTIRLRTGKFGFDDLRRVALATMAEIARSALSAGIGSILSGGGGGKGGGSKGFDKPLDDEIPF